MPKSKRRRASDVSPAPFVPLPLVAPGLAPPGFNPAGPGEQRNIVSSKDGWSEYTLDDGTVVRLKAVLVDAKRAAGQYAPDGNPLYLYALANITQTLAPEHLRKKDQK